RAVVQTGTGPTVIRLSDEAETGVNLATTESIGEDSITGGCLAITVFEGSAAHADSRLAETRALLGGKGGTSFGGAPRPPRGGPRPRMGARPVRRPVPARRAAVGGRAVRDARDRDELVQLARAQGRRHRRADDFTGRVGHASACAVPHFARVSDWRVAVFHRG